MFSFIPIKPLKWTISNSWNGFPFGRRVRDLGNIQGSDLQLLLRKGKQYFFSYKTCSSSQLVMKSLEKNVRVCVCCYGLFSCPLRRGPALGYCLDTVYLTLHWSQTGCGSARPPCGFETGGEGKDGSGTRRGEGAISPHSRSRRVDREVP